MRYRTRPMVIDAVLVTDEWFDGEHPNPLHPKGVVINPRYRTVEFNIEENGADIACVGDWIVTYPSGVMDAVCDREFKRTYEEDIEDVGACEDACAGLA